MHNDDILVITSYSIHYTKLYEMKPRCVVCGVVAFVAAVMNGTSERESQQTSYNFV